MTEELDRLSLEQRVARLEGRLGWREHSVPLSSQMRPWAFALVGAALGLCYLGLGLPNHYYQIALSVLTLALAYHRGWFAWPAAKIDWFLIGLNTCVLSLLLKLVIGSGKRFPMDWVYYPLVQKNEASEQKWGSVVPDWDIVWQPSPIAAWSIDLTIVQTFLLLVTLIGALVDFQPFISLTALLLVVVSIPALVSFEWAWVFPAIVVSAIALYVQSAEANE